MLEGKREVLLWAKYQFFKAGISPSEFRKTQMRDLKDIMDLDAAIEEKAERNKGIHDALARMKSKW